MSDRQPPPVISPQGGVSPFAMREEVPTRTLLGLHVASDCRRLEAAQVQITGQGSQVEVRIVDQESSPLGETIAGRFARLRDSQFESPGEMALLAAELAEVQAKVAGDLLDRSLAGLPPPLAIGVTDPGLWHLRRDHPPCYASLCDAAQLAARTGINVIDAFAAADLAAGGIGGPVGALPLWFLLRDASRPRILLDLGRTVRLTYLPAANAPRAIGSILAFDVGPGTSLLDYLARRFSDGKIEFDPGGRLAVQGRKIDKLIEHWLDAPYFREPLPRWNPVGVHPYEELEESIRMAAETGWSVRDLLCTANHLIVRCIERDIERWIPAHEDVAEILLVGGGAQNGLLLAELGKCLPGVKLVPASSQGFDEMSLDAAVAAVLAALFIERRTAGLPNVTGATSPSLLGRWTPGSTAAIEGLLRAMAPATADELRRAV
ncbi:MAG: hypothetical protein DWQ31_05965 [Planctomycetota bacterium]|nr:MAG: hypothetical protein DWQ31_05965 [Planctomycetota bacterium]REJ98555.1 MAG: hypothetical protein DWQ35_00720 [Planctomycetota bacterium]